MKPVTSGQMREIDRRTIPGWFEGKTSTTVTMNWTVPEPAGAHTIYAVVDPDAAVTEYNEYNNQQWLTLGGTDLMPMGVLSSSVEDDGSARMVVKVRNAGGPVSLQAERLAGKDSKLDSVVMRGLCFAIVDEADSVLIDEAATPLILTQSGMSCEQENKLYKDACAVAKLLKRDTHYLLDESKRSVRLTEAGQDKLETIAKVLGGQWKLRARREELAIQALTARYLFLRDREYLVRDGEVMIIDDLTGRVMGDRKWERGLHQMIEIAEGCEPSPPNEVLARISYQRFFRRYLHLCGMTGTARETAGELEQVYGLRVRKIPTHQPSKLIAEGETVFASAAARWEQLVERLRDLHQQQRPLLVGTTVWATANTSASCWRRPGCRTRSSMPARMPTRRTWWHAPASPAPSPSPPTWPGAAPISRWPRAWPISAACTCSPPSATRPAASTASCSAAPPARARPAVTSRCCRWKTASCATICLNFYGLLPLAMQGNRAPCLPGWGPLCAMSASAGQSSSSASSAGHWKRWMNTSAGCSHSPANRNSAWTSFGTIRSGT